MREERVVGCICMLRFKETKHHGVVMVMGKLDGATKKQENV